MSKGLEYIRDISCLIAEYYSDKEPLTEEQKLSKNCFLDYCKYIAKELNRLEQIDNAKPSEALECSLKLYKMVESAGNGNCFNLNEAWEYHKTIKQALIKAQELKCENKALLEENNDLYAELTLANKQYKELIENTKQYQKVLELIKSKTRFYDNNTKCKIEIEADDFNSSKEWEQIERWKSNNDLQKPKINY